MIKSILPLCVWGLCLATGIYLIPMIIETDAELCAPYKPIERGPTNVLYCQCKHNKSKPGKCEEKYNNEK